MKALILGYRQLRELESEEAQGDVCLGPAFTGNRVPFCTEVSVSEPGENQMRLPLKSDLLEVLK